MYFCRLFGFLFIIFIFFSHEWLDFGFELELQNSVLILLQRAREFFLAVP